MFNKLYIYFDFHENTQVKLQHESGWEHIGPGEFAIKTIRAEIVSELNEIDADKFWTEKLKYLKILFYDEKFICSTKLDDFHIGLYDHIYNYNRDLFDKYRNWYYITTKFPDSLSIIMERLKELHIYMEQGENTWTFFFKDFEMLKNVLMFRHSIIEFISVYDDIKQKILKELWELLFVNDNSMNTVIENYKKGLK